MGTPNRSFTGMTARELVVDVLGPKYPRAVANKLVAEVATMIADNISETIIEAALIEWDTRPGAGPSLLPHIASDLLRIRKEVHADWEAKLREEMGG